MPAAPGAHFSLNRSIISDSGRAMLVMLIGLSGFVLLIACSNLANLLLARTMARAREFAVRSALGASQSQLLRPLIAEAMLLALAGGAGAVVVAKWIADWLSVRSAEDNGERMSFALDWHVLGWAFAASIITAIAFGIAPALFALRLNVNQTLKSGARGMTGGRGHQRFRQTLIVGQFALAMVLLAGAGLYIRGLTELNQSRGGWQSDRLLTGTVALPTATYGDAEKINTFHRLAIQRLQAIPGVAAVSVSSFTPFFNWSDIRKFIVEGRELPQPGHEPAAVVNTVSPGYFSTVQTRILAGRAFDDHDNIDASKVCIVSQSMAAALFGKENPIGRRLAQTGVDPATWAEIVGIAEDVKSVIPDPGPVTLQLYQALTQETRPLNEIAVRTAGSAPATLVAAVRQAMTELDPDLPVRQLQPANVTIERANYQSAVLRDILSSFAVLGLALASLGIYGVIARTMAQRTGEFAIRFALGACIRDISYLVLTSGLKLAILGAGLGLLGAFGVARFLAADSPGMHFNNPAVFLGASALLMVVALVACWAPARRAAAINPIDALRAD